MNAALPTPPAPSVGVAMAARPDQPAAGRDGARSAVTFLDQIVQALGTAGGASPAVPSQAAPPPVPAPAAQDGQGAAPSPQNVLPQAALAPAQGAALPDSPASLQAGMPGAEVKAKDDARPAAPSSDRRPAAARPGAAVESTRHAVAQPDQPPILPTPAAPLPSPIPAVPGQAAPEQGSRTGNGAAADDSARTAQSGIEHLPGRHEPVLAAGAEVTQQAAAPDTAPLKTFAPSLAVAAPADPGKAGLASATGIDALAPPSAAPPGNGAVPARAEPAPPVAPATSAQPSPPAPVAQMAPALVHITAATGGAQQVTVRLDPVELGELRVHIERSREGPVQVTVEATRPETLQLLRQDEPALHRALDQAGLQPEGRVVVLQQTSPDSGGQREGAASSSLGNGQGGSQGGGRGGNQGWTGDGNGAPNDGAPRRNAWLRAGLDITA